jgi:hypothetical protein
MREKLHVRICEGASSSRRLYSTLQLRWHCGLRSVGEAELPS